MAYIDRHEINCPQCGEKKPYFYNGYCQSCWRDLMELKRSFEVKECERCGMLTEKENIEETSLDGDAVQYFCLWCLEDLRLLKWDGS